MHLNFFQDKELKHRLKILKHPVSKSNDDTQSDLIDINKILKENLIPHSIYMAKNVLGIVVCICNQEKCFRLVFPTYISFNWLESSSKNQPEQLPTYSGKSFIEFIEYVEQKKWSSCNIYEDKNGDPVIELIKN